MSDSPNIDKIKEDSFHAGQGNDVLSEVLGFMGLQGRVFCRATLRTPWSMTIPAGRLAHFHFIERGVCRLRLDGETEDRLMSTGEIAVLPHGSGHLLCDSPGRASKPISDIVGTSTAGRGCAIVQHGGSGEETRMLCGSFSFHRDREPLILKLLPSVLVMFVQESDKADLLHTILRLMMMEAASQQPGSALVLSRMVETLFVQILRSWLSESGRHPEGLGNWLTALRDERIGRALGAIHARPDHPWTVLSLATLAGMSRSAFAAFFARSVGETPLTYVKRWRMNLAAGCLEDGKTLEEIAEKVGYDSASSFGKAFKTVMGIAPGDWRRQYGAHKKTDMNQGRP